MTKGKCASDLHRNKMSWNLSAFHITAFFLAITFFFLMQGQKTDFESSRNSKKFSSKINLLRNLFLRPLQHNQTPKAIGFIANEMTLKIYISLNVVRNKMPQGKHYFI